MLDRRMVRDAGDFKCLTGERIVIREIQNAYAAVQRPP